MNKNALEISRERCQCQPLTFDLSSFLFSLNHCEGSRYSDEKYVKSACGVTYLGVLKAIEESLLKKGLTKKELPKKVEEYRKALQKHASAHNGKLIKEFDDLYDELHIAGYYRGNLHRVEVVKGVLKGAKEFIQKLK